MEKRLFRKNDFYLILALLLLFLMTGAYFFLAKNKGSYVKVLVNGEITHSFPLSENTKYIINGFNGGVNTLVIKDGYACIKDSSCPDHLCEDMGRISKTGQSVICLPNRVVIEITGDGGENEYDAVVGAIFMRMINNAPSPVEGGLDE